MFEQPPDLKVSANTKEGIDIALPAEQGWSVTNPRQAEQALHRI